MKKQIHTVDFIKRQAKRLKKEHGITHAAALEIAAKEYGFMNWQHFLQAVSVANTDSVSKNFDKNIK